MRISIKREPFTNKTRDWTERGLWPAKWIGHPQVTAAEPSVTAYKKTFRLESASVIRIHATADERYDLFLDGRRIGRGPERGDAENWFYESYDLDLAAGEHTLVARTWWLGTKGPSPHAQMTVRPGFLLAAQGMEGDLLNTGIADWKCKILGGYNWLSPDMAWGTGAKVHIRGSEYPWGFERGEGDDWEDAVEISSAINASVAAVWPRLWMLSPAMLPAMMEEPKHIGRARHVESIDTEETCALTVESRNHLEDECAAWNRLLRGETTLTIAPKTMRRVIVDLENYYCAYPQVTLSGGKNARTRIRWAESLYEDYETGTKGNRDVIEQKVFVGVGDTFETDGGRHRSFDTLWWEAGRYLEITVTTSETPLEIEEISLIETHYPYEIESEFTCDDRNLNDVIPIALRSLAMCSHETYMDCPYYEQLMYVGDSRLETLVTYVTTHDDRLPRKALLLFDKSRQNSGLTQAQYPSRWMQIIPSFSLWWISMVHDYAMWRSDPDFVADRIPGIRTVIDAFVSYINNDGLVESPNGWNYVDWVPDWHMGIAPDAEHGVSSAINWQMIMALNQATQLEELYGETEFVTRNRRLAEALAHRATEAFWDEKRGIFADDLTKEHFSEHAQCLALLSGAITDSTLINRISEGLLGDPDLARTTIYFKHYLYEAYRVLGKMDSFIEKMGLWFKLGELGLKTTIEQPEPSRSDCHAWGSHPMFHYFASILGIRPSAPGFAEVKITPQLGTLTRARGVVPHPNGYITADFTIENRSLSGSIELPKGIVGTLEYGGKIQKLHPGHQEIAVSKPPILQRR